MTTNMSRTSDDPAIDPRVRSLLAAAAAPTETTGPLPGEDEALAAFRTSLQGSKRTSRLSSFVSAKAAVASAIGTGVLLTGAGAAAAGVLPGAAQETVSAWLETVGISVPAGERADEHGDLRGRSEQAPVEGADENIDRPGSEQPSGEEAELPAAADHGKRVSETAKDSTAEGADKGKEIAGVASDGRVESGDRGSAQAPQDGKPAAEDDREPPVSAPNSGSGTASDATDRQSGPPGQPTRR